MPFIKDWKSASDKRLIEFIANARKTCMTALGHTKSEMNEYWLNQYLAEAEKRDLELPDAETLSETGRFNGDGAV